MYIKKVLCLDEEGLNMISDDYDVLHNDIHNLKKYRLGICSGFFNPLHQGHLDYLQEAKKHCEKLIVIVNSDKKVKDKESIPFLDESTRLNIIKALECVDEAVISGSINNKNTIKSDILTAHNIAEEILYSNVEVVDTHLNFTNKNIVYFDSGDRRGAILPLDKMEICDVVFLDLPKINSSSRIVKKMSKSIPGTIFLDIDGTILNHPNGLVNTLSQLKLQVVLPDVHKKIEEWKFAGHTIILVTARPEPMRNFTENQLEMLCIPYDQLIMGLPHGHRYLINDTKPGKSSQTATAYTVVRDKGLENFSLNNRDN